MCVLFSVRNTLVDLNWNLWEKKKSTLTLDILVLKYKKSLKLKFCFLFSLMFLFFFSLCVCVCVSVRAWVCVSLLNCICVLRSPCYDTRAPESVAWLQRHTAKSNIFCVKMVIWRPHEYCMLPKQVFPICRQEGKKNKQTNGPLLKTFVSYFFLFFCLSCICFCIITVYGFCIKCIRVLGCKWNFIHILSKYLL